MMNLKGGVVMKRYAIVYFSHTGNTQRIAYALHRKLPSDLFHIIVKKPYTTKYICQLEGSKVDVTTKSFQDYEGIILCTPIWWFGIAAPVKAFLNKQVLFNENMIVFCIHGGYGIGHSKQDILSICRNLKYIAFFEVPFHLRKMAIPYVQFTQMIKTIQKEEVKYDENTHIFDTVSTGITSSNKI